jgi:hypothetical protein
MCEGCEFHTLHTFTKTGCESLFAYKVVSHFHALSRHRNSPAPACALGTVTVLRKFPFTTYARRDGESRRYVEKRREKTSFGLETLFGLVVLVSADRKSPPGGRCQAQAQLDDAVAVVRVG